MTGNPRVVSVSGSMYDIIAQKGEDVLFPSRRAERQAACLPRAPMTPASSAWRTPPWQHAHGRGPVSQLQVYLGHAQPTAKHITICGDRGGLDVEQMVLYQNVGGYQGETKLKYFDIRPFARGAL